MPNRTTIEQFLELVYATENTIEESTRRFYTHKLHKFSLFLCRSAKLSDLNRDTINKFLSYRLAQNVAPNTVRGDRSALLAMWNYAVKADVLDAPPARVKLIKKVLKVVDGWDETQRADLLRQIDKLEGEFKGKSIGRREFWRAVVLTMYDTGLRLGDLMNLDAAQLRGEGVITVVQRKTKKIVEVPIGPEAWAAIQAIHPRRRKKPFGDVICRHWFFQRFAELCDLAGLDGRTKKLRITSGSEIERLHPGCGHLHLGNTRQVFDSHYRAARIARHEPKLPPRFGGDS